MEHETIPTAALLDFVLLQPIMPPDQWRDYAQAIGHGHEDYQRFLGQVRAQAENVRNAPHLLRTHSDFLIPSQDSAMLHLRGEGRDVWIIALAKARGYPTGDAYVAQWRNGRLTKHMMNVGLVIWLGCRLDMDWQPRPVSELLGE